MKITDRTRKNIIQIFKSEGVKWQGKMNDVDFLSRIYDLDSLPSTDPRYKTAKWDISTHRISFPEDWREDWVFGDPRFDLHHCSDEDFLKFLCETIDPTVRTDQKEVDSLLQEFNRSLGEDGIQIVKEKTPFGNVRYQGKGITPSTIGALSEIHETISRLDWSYIDREIIRIKNSVEKDPELAIGTAKELVESVCKTILTQRGDSLTGKEDLPKLMQKTLQGLGSLGVSQEKKEAEEATKKILGAGHACPEHGRIEKPSRNWAWKGRSNGCVRREIRGACSQRGGYHRTISCPSAHCKMIWTRACCLRESCESVYCE